MFEKTLNHNINNIHFDIVSLLNAYLRTGVINKGVHELI